MATVRYRYNPQTLSYDRVNTNYNWLKILLRIVIMLGLLYFIIGYSLVLFRNFDQTKFFNSIGIVGTIASILGLFSFFTGKINKKDIENIGTEYLKEVIEASEKLKEKESILLAKEMQLTSKEREIQELELKKTEIEFAIRKVGMSIFLKDQLERIENRLIEILNSNKDLMLAIEDRKRLIKQLAELEEQIESSPNTELIEEIISLVNRKSDVSKNESSLLMNLLKSISFFS